MRPVNKTETPVDRVTRELHRALDNARADLDRVEILTGALWAFSKPVPEYEPRFHHLRDLALSAQELG
jgi:hypothetical protein